jgi:CDP-diacylglycerol--glycerol-3-phosphate 3-phosphatidyltransferase
MVRSIPNILTFGRLVLTIVFLVMILYAPPRYARGELPFPDFLDIAFILFVIAGLSDIVDGIVARQFKVTSKFGRMVDPLADKVMVCGAFICFAIVGEPKLFNLGPAALAVIHWVVAAVLILREVFVTALRHIAEARGINFAATASGKIKMFLQSFAIGTVIMKMALAIGTVIMKMAHVQTATWGYWFTTVAFALMLIVTVISGVRATQRSSWKEAAAT